MARHPVTALATPAVVIQPAWGSANHRRGASHATQALAFVRAFPIGTTLSSDAFDGWAQKKGWLNVPTGAPKRSDAWLAHLQRRHQLRYQINKAGTHPRMLDMGATAFVIEAMNMGTWQVRAPHAATLAHNIPKKIDSLITTKRRQLRELMQSADWSLVPPYERALADMLYKDIELFARRIGGDADGLQEKFLGLQTTLRLAIERGEVQPRNHGLNQLINDPDESTPPIQDDIAP